MKPIHEPAMASADVSRSRADDIIGWLRRYAEERIDSRLFDERRCVPPYVILDFGNRGILGMQIPEEFGGLALRNADFLRVLEQLAAIDLSLASLVFIHNANGIRPIVGYATPAMREELLPLLAKGRELSAFALTEPVAGSNLPGIATVAVPDGQAGWRLRGAKRWNGSGWAGVMSVFARTVGDGGRLGHVTGFVVRQGMPGLRVGPESPTMGVRSIMQNSIFFDDVPVRPVHVLGEVGKGMDVADEALLVARLCMGAMSLGAMKRCAGLMARYATRRIVSTGRLIDSPITQDVFSRLAIKIALVQALVDRLVEVMDDGDYPPEEGCMIAKIVASDSLWETADDLVEILGGRGYMENNIAPQIMRDCRMLRIGEGANELMTLSVGRRVYHSEKLHDFLRARLGCPGLSEQLKDVSQRIQQRCLARGAPFVDRSSALSWAFNLVGRVAIKGVLMAAAQETARRTPSALLDRAVAWAGLQFETVLNEALHGTTAESFLLSAETITHVVAGYRDAIGDIEQAPPGVEEAIDPLLRRDPIGGGFPKLTHLPGNVDATRLDAKLREPIEREALTSEQKRTLAAQLLRRRHAAGLGNPSTANVNITRESLSESSSA
jgi:alkylation response protein AidB-like acyl-CoA dehydrogenase